MDIVEFYKQADALLEGHFLLSSGKHSPFYLQSAKVLENPKTAQMLTTILGEMIKQSKISIDCVCSPALGGILAGYELARALGVRFIFTERVQGVMNLRRGFSVSKHEKILVCEDIITTGGSAMECARVLEVLGGEIIGYAALINRGICKRTYTDLEEINNNKKKLGECKLNTSLPLFALGDFTIETYEATDCPLCKQGSTAIKPGSRGN